VCVYVSSFSCEVFALTRHGWDGGITGGTARIAHNMRGNNVGWIDNIDVCAVEYLRWYYWHWTMFYVISAEHWESNTTASRKCLLSVFQTDSRIREHRKTDLHFRSPGFARAPQVNLSELSFVVMSEHGADLAGPQGTLARLRECVRVLYTRAFKDIQIGMCVCARTHVCACAHGCASVH
jgi:hypothetical protein